MALLIKNKFRYLQLHVSGCSGCGGLNDLCGWFIVSNLFYKSENGNRGCIGLGILGTIKFIGVNCWLERKSLMQNMHSPACCVMLNPSGSWSCAVGPRPWLAPMLWRCWSSSWFESLKDFELWIDMCDISLKHLGWDENWVINW